MSFIRLIVIFLLATAVFTEHASAQCLSSANPVGGSNNLLVLEKKSLRIISFYRYNFGSQYYEGSSKSDFNLIKNANYNYLGNIFGYGLADRLTMEAEIGYFINKTQNFNIDPQYTLRGSGFSNTVLSAKYGLIKKNDSRFFLSSSLGVKIPLSTNPIIKDGVELPVDVQPTLGSFGMVAQLFMVKEKTLTGSRYFVTGRLELNSANKKEYKLGTSMFTSLFYSKHLMFPWLKGDWTVILQVRDELRGKDKTITGLKESSGSHLLYLAPQINYFIMEKWNISLMVDIPVYKYFNGIQLATKYGISVSLARDFRL